MRYFIVATAALVACTSSAAVQHTSSTSVAKPQTATVAGTWPVPNNGITPGGITPGCTYPRPTSDRYVTEATKRYVAEKYGYTGQSGLTYVEYDHRIPFSLCGGNGIYNIWPEPADGIKQSEFVHNRKDQLEAYAAREVRYHHWSLSFAQNVFRGDWRVAWCKYIHSAGVTC